MNQELSFETLPFEFDPEFQDEEFEEENEKGRMRTYSRQSSGFRSPSMTGKHQKSKPAFSQATPKKSPVRKPSPSGFRPRGPWGVIREPYGLLSEPYPGEPEPSDSERVRWTQDCLNQAMRLQLPVTGVMGPETRSAVRSFQKQQGLRVSGIVSPKTEQTLSSACEGGQASRGPSEELEDFWEVLASNAEMELEKSPPPVSPPRATFRLECPNPPGCTPVAAGQCRDVLRRAIIEAIKLANDAASKLEAAIKVEPSKRDVKAKQTAHKFLFFFGHDPSRPVTYADNKASGAIVAQRFRAVAKALQTGGRNTLFRCLVALPGCADDDLTCCLSDANAWVSQAEPNVLNLCPLFWNPPAGLRGLPPTYYRAGVIIHEMLHMLFHEFLQHATRSANAHCYEAFALRLADFGAAPIDVCLCRGTTPCPP